VGRVDGRRRSPPLLPTVRGQHSADMTLDHRVVGLPVWCARRWDGTGAAQNADSPEHLAEYIRDQAGS